MYLCHICVIPISYWPFDVIIFLKLLVSLCPYSCSCLCFLASNKYSFKKICKGPMMLLVEWRKFCLDFQTNWAYSHNHRVCQQVSQWSTQSEQTSRRDIAFKQVLSCGKRILHSLSHKMKNFILDLNLLYTFP